MVVVVLNNEGVSRGYLQQQLEFNSLTGASIITSPHPLSIKSSVDIYIPPRTYTVMPTGLPGTSAGSLLLEEPLIRVSTAGIVEYQLLLTSRHLMNCSDVNTVRLKDKSRRISRVFR